jgi:hypothetical protein
VISRAQIWRILAALLFAALVAGLLLALHSTSITATSFLWRSLYNFSHVPLFGAVALLIWAMLLNLPGIRSRGRTTIYLLTFASVMLLAAGSEWMQVHGPRDADFWDFARDVVGAFCVLALLASFDGALRKQAPWKRRNFRRKVRTGAAILLLIAFIPVAIWLESYRRRSAQMPMLMRFDSGWELKFVDANGAWLELVPTPSGWVEMERERVGKVSFSAFRFPGLIFREPFPDWTPYSSFSLELYSELSHPVDIVLRIDDAYANQYVEDRFNLRVTLQPGPNLIRFPLDDVRTAPETRTMDLSAIDMMVLFAVHPEEPFFIYVADMKLE